MRSALALVALAACGGDDVPSGPPPPNWSAGPPLPSPRLEAGVIGFDGAVWVIGGFDDGLEISADTWILDSGATGWRPGPPAPERLSHLNLAVAGGRLYLLGGLLGQALVPLGSSWVLSEDRTSWTSLHPMPIGEERAAAAVIPTAAGIMIAGGATVDRAISTVLLYAPADDRWSDGPTLPNVLSHPVGTVDGAGRPLVIGGLHSLDARDATADVFVLDGGEWQRKAPMPTARGGCSTAVIDGRFYCIGGEAGVAVLSAVEAYDPAADTWTSLPGLPRGRGGTGGAAWDGVAIAPGGAHRLAWEPTADVDVYDPTP